MYDLIIIGGGAAAASAAVYALGKQLDFLVIYDELGKAGRTQRLDGELGEEFLPGAEAVRLFERQVVSHAGRTQRDRVAEVTKEAGVFHVTTHRHGVHESRAVIVATGATPIALDVPGAKALLGQGLGYSIATHAHILAGKSVVVIGTTVRTLRGVIELSRTAAQIYLVAPDAAGVETPLAHAIRQCPHIEILEGYEVQQVVGGSNVAEVVVACDGHVRRLRVDAAFVDLGLTPNSQVVRRIVQ